MQKLREFVLNNRKIALTGAALIDALCIIGLAVIIYRAFN